MDRSFFIGARLKGGNIVFNNGMLLIAEKVQGMEL
jgi:hypothetical protein